MTRIATVESKFSMNKSVIIGAVLIVLVLAGVIMAVKPKQGPATPAASAPSGTVSRSSGPLAAGEMRYEFGPVSMAAGNVSHRYWFKNASAAPVLIRKIYTSCMCTTATLVKGGKIIDRYGMPGHGITPSVNESVAPGEEAYVEVVFDPAAHGPSGLGRTERVVTIENDAGQPLELEFTADVRP